MSSETEVLLVGAPCEVCGHSGAFACKVEQ